MDKQLVRDLLPLVNDKGDMDSLVDYANYRLKLAYHDLKSARTELDLGVIQGRIKELEYIISLRDTVVTKAKEYASS